MRPVSHLQSAQFDLGDDFRRDFSRSDFEVFKSGFGVAGQWHPSLLRTWPGGPEKKSKKSGPLLTRLPL